jgi:hypothetical protein
MPKHKTSPETQGTLKGWTEIAKFLELPTSKAHLWAKQGMPVRREGRYVYASLDELKNWLQSSTSIGPVKYIVGN